MNRVRVVPLLATLLLFASSCVWPVPLPGQPVPSIEATFHYSPATQTVTVEAVPTNITPTELVVWPTGFAGAATAATTSAPWIVEFDVIDIEPGTHEARVMFNDGATYVTLPFTYDVFGCNGSVALCGQPYDEVAYATAHNAMANSTNGWLGPNQTWDIPTQLEAGVRALMLDTYRAGDLNAIGQVEVPGVHPDTGYLCHAFCALGSQPLTDALIDIDVFLGIEPGHVVTLIVESYLDHQLTAEAFVASGLYTHAYVHVPGTPWPTLGELVAADTQLVVLQDRSIDPAHPYLLNVWDHAYETDFSNTVPTDFTCDPNRGSTSNDLFILNHFLTDVFGSPALAEQVNHNPFLADRVGQCAAFHDDIVNFVTVDFVDIGDTLAVVDSMNQ